MCYMGNSMVLVGLSGGVDSAVAAFLLKKAGYEVVGLYLILWKYRYGPNNLIKNEEILKMITQIIGIDYKTIDVTDEFWNRIVKYFIAELSRGVTPNPCVICNPTLKLTTFLEQADNYKFELISTGHYARIIHSGNVFGISRAKDSKKDQSYMLNQLTQKHLKRLILPLGELNKSYTREVAREIGLPIEMMRESQDLCFLSGHDYRKFIKEYAPEILQPGDIVNLQGEVVGEHQGLAFYTIGQRKGIGINGDTPLYVIRKDIKLNRLIVSSENYLGSDQLIAGPVNWISGEAPPLPSEMQVKIRSTVKMINGLVSPMDKKFVKVKFKDPLRDITPGQYACFYQDDLLLGGGMIKD